MTTKSNTEHEKSSFFTTLALTLQHEHWISSKCSNEICMLLTQIMYVNNTQIEFSAEQRGSEGQQLLRRPGDSLL